MDRVEDCISFLIGKAGQQIARRARDKLAAYAVTPTQYAVLKVLWEQDGLSGAELGGRL
ncbi:MAG: MarR family transcriptional regulator, partial [Gemmatimonadaceae bacterium]|nr:MarR family transcriptional regulator [Acetobacteraceae bacterium]